MFTTSAMRSCSSAHCYVILMFFWSWWAHVLFDSGGLPEAPGGERGDVPSTLRQGGQCLQHRDFHSWEGQDQIHTVQSPCSLKERYAVLTPQGLPYLSALMLYVKVKTQHSGQEHRMTPMDRANNVCHSLFLPSFLRLFVFSFLGFEGNAGQCQVSLFIYPNSDTWCFLLCAHFSIFFLLLFITK